MEQQGLRCVLCNAQGTQCYALFRTVFLQQRVPEVGAAAPSVLMKNKCGAYAHRTDARHSDYVRTVHVYD
jgi:hypothetical protein